MKERKSEQNAISEKTAIVQHGWITSEAALNHKGNRGPIVFLENSRINLYFLKKSGINL